MASLLAIDIGLRSGLAYYNAGGRLISYHSRNFTNRQALRTAAWQILREEEDLMWVILEGGGDLAEIWTKAAQRRGINVHQLSAETWRDELLLKREQRSGTHAKDAATQLARHVITWSRAPAPTSFRHDTAEAILVGLWAVLRLGWLPALPPDLRH